MIMHIDANSFYASCERIFRPDLNNAPIVVLSNNDGIIVALTPEAKALGFSRGDVFFKVKEACKKKGVAVFSSNYTLYSDISSRIVSIYNRLCSDVEVYSIDESFLFFDNLNRTSLLEIAHTIRDTVLKEVGIRVSVGIAPSKTLTKICNKLAKKRSGVCFYQDINIEKELSQIPVSEVWGIGRAKSAYLLRHNIKTALDLKNYSLYKAKKSLSITGVRTIQDLNGILSNQRIYRDKHDSIGCSKSFSGAVDNIQELETALASYTQEAVKRMREDGTAAKYVTVFLMTNPMSSCSEPFFNQASAEFPFITSYLPKILGTAINLLRNIYKPGFRYRKVMIYLLGLEDERVRQPDFFINDLYRDRNQGIMSCYDKLNKKYGRGALFTGTSILRQKEADGADATWKMQRKYLSPNYTTSLKDLPRVY